MALSAVIAGGAEEPKKPWLWTAAERAQARRDPAMRLERVRAHEDRLRRSGIRPNGVPRAADAIDGNTHPELYFPTELFEDLVRSAFVTLPAAYPNAVRQRTSDLFRKEAEWDRFAPIVADYARVLKERKTPADAAARCAAEARAFREARRVFGQERFDRMLYETVPPGMSTTFSIDTDFETSIGKALEREERCQ